MELRKDVCPKRANSEPYHKAVSKGRHPRSFPPSSDVWHYVQTAKYREKKVSQGQHLWEVLGDDESGKEIVKPKVAVTIAEKTSILSDINEVIQPDNKAQSTGGKKETPDENLRRLSGRLSNFRDREHRKWLQHQAALQNAQGTRSSRKMTHQSDATSRAKYTSKTQPEGGAKFGDVLQQEFSTQKDARLHYGASIAFESVFHEDKFLHIDQPHGDVYCKPIDDKNSKNSKVLFQVLDMKDLQCADPIKFGDAIWLQVAAGNGEPDWRHGSVFGAKVRRAPQLETVSNGYWPVRNPSDVTQNIGFPAPVIASLPRGREGQDDSVQNALVNVHSTKNKKPTFLGRWKILPATAAQKAKELEYELSDDKDRDKRSEAAQHITNFSEVYLEQDWFYVTADPESDKAILRQLPKQQPKGSKYVLDRRGIWKIRILDSNTQTGLTLVQQQMERLLGKAKMQLRKSSSMRQGLSKQYEPDLNCGGRFPKQVRNKLRHIQDKTDQKVINREYGKHKHLADYFCDRFSGLSTNELPPSPFINPHHNRRGPFSQNGWKMTKSVHIGERKNEVHEHHAHKHLDAYGNLIVSKSMPLLGAVDKSAAKHQNSAHHLTPLHGHNRKSKRHGHRGHHHEKHHERQKSRKELKTHLEERQVIREKQLGHFPAFYDLPRILAKLEIQEGDVKNMLVDEHGERAIDAEMRTAMENAEAVDERKVLSIKLQGQDNSMAWNLDYKQKHEKLSGLFDTLYHQQHEGDDELGESSTFITQADSDSGIAAGEAAKLSSMLGAMKGAPVQKAILPVKMELAMERFDGNMKHLNDMMHSLKQLCEERVLPQLLKAFRSMDTSMMQEEAEFLMEAGDIIAADPVAMASGELIAAVDAIDREQEIVEAEAASIGLEGADSTYHPPPRQSQEGDSRTCCCSWTST